MRAVEAICSNEWAIREDFLRLMLKISMREDPLDQDALNTLIQPVHAVSTQAGSLLTGTDTIEVRDGVAIVPVTGPIMRYATLFSKISGATSVDMIARDFTTALQDRSIKSILLNIDSPGGQVNGIGELADIIHAARGIKPVYAYIGHEGASAAYWLAAAADKIYASKTSIVGSIGCVAAFPDPKAQPAESKHIEIVSSQSPNKRVDVSTKEGRSHIQALVDDLAQVFVDSVATFRGVTSDYVIEHYGQGGVFVGLRALDAGLVDGISSFEEVLSIASGDISNKPSKDKEETKAMGLREQIQALLSGESEDIEATTPVVPPVSATVNPPVQSNSSDDRVRQLEQENNRLRAERYTAEATSFADGLIASNKAFPAERETIIAMFVQASFDDHLFGAVNKDGNSRVSMLQALMATRPEHVLTAETIVPALANLARVPMAQQESDSKKPLDDDGLKAMLEKTPLGREVLTTFGKNGSA